MSKSSTKPSRPSGAKPASYSLDSGRPGWVVPAAVVGVIVAAIAAVVVLATRGSDGTDPAAAAKVAHVHGLGINPADGQLYAGTHYGLFRVPEQGQPNRIADRVQDFMGFTVAGPNHYLASGHPGAGQAGPSALGLIESTDGGQTWTTLSLAGEADFHGLEARHGRVYGLNAATGAFMVSQDKKTWETRSEPRIADFAVSPQSPDVILGTTQEGLARSTDGGRTFTLIASAPVLLLVTWADDGTIVGVDPQGIVQVSTDDGATWQRRGTLDGSPAALTAKSGEEIYAAIQGAILASTDGGRTFTPRYQESE